MAGRDVAAQAQDAGLARTVGRDLLAAEEIALRKTHTHRLGGRGERLDGSQGRRQSSASGIMISIIIKNNCSGQVGALVHHTSVDEDQFLAIGGHSSDCFHSPKVDIPDASSAKQHPLKDEKHPVSAKPLKEHLPSAEELMLNTATPDQAIAMPASSRGCPGMGLSFAMADAFFKLWVSDNNRREYTLDKPIVWQNVKLPEWFNPPGICPPCFLDVPGLPSSTYFFPCIHRRAISDTISDVSLTYLRIVHLPCEIVCFVSV